MPRVVLAQNRDHARRVHVFVFLSPAGTNNPWLRPSTAVKGGDSPPEKPLPHSIPHLETAADCSRHIREHLLERARAVRAEDSEVYHTPSFLKPVVVADEQQRALEVCKRPFLSWESEPLLLDRFQLQLFLEVEAVVGGM